MAGFDRVSFRSGPQIDMPLLIAIVAISTLGVVNLYSASSAYVGDPRHSGLAEIYISQIYWIVIGLLFGTFVAAIDYRHYERLAMVAYAGGLASLGLVFAIGTGVRGGLRWIQLGPLTFQPSEFMKILVVLVVAKFMHNDSKTEPRTLLELLIPILLTIVPVGAVMAQPDLGTSLVYVLITGSMLSITKIKRRSVLLAFIIGISGIFAGWEFYMHDYQKARVLSFLDPKADISGTGWHALQSQTAIGNGRWFGEGLMQGTQNQFGFLPDQYSDFPFSVFAEEWGFFGAIGLLGIYAFLCVWSIHIASQAKDRFGAGIAIGIGALFFWHIVFNVGMAIGVLPIVGITLPLFSYGGSSVLTMLIGLGLLMNVSMRR